MHVTPRRPEDVDELRRRIAGEKDAKQRDRYRAVLLAIEGEKTDVIMNHLARSKNFVQRWVYFYRDHGLERIRPLKQPGQPQRLSHDREQEFLDLLNNSQSNLRGVDVVELLAEHFGVVYSLNGAYDLLHRLNYEPLMPRPVNPQKNAEEQARWLRNAPLLSGPCRKPIGTRRSKSGSRMSADSDRRDA